MQAPALSVEAAVEAAPRRAGGVLDDGASDEEVEEEEEEDEVSATGEEVGSAVGEGMVQVEDSEENDEDDEDDGNYDEDALFFLKLSPEGVLRAKLLYKLHTVYITNNIDGHDYISISNTVKYFNMGSKARRQCIMCKTAGATHYCVQCSHVRCYPLFMVICQSCQEKHSRI